MKRRVVGSLVCVAVLAVCLGAAGGPGQKGSAAECKALMEKVGTQSKRVLNAENAVKVAQQAMDDCRAQARNNHQDEKAACKAQTDTWKKKQTSLTTEQETLNKMQAQYDAKCK